ncbi:MAG TPA: hypothetical protein VMT46_15785 [Anaerolineaceae bacterium]|nr:hypothetical protein [Anaerolineaceae bacterium]
MKQKSVHFKKLLVLSALIALLASAVLAAAPTPVQAGIDDGLNPTNPFPPVPTVSPGDKNDPVAVLNAEKQFEVQKQAWLQPAYNLAAKVRKYIKDRTARGLDSSKLVGELNKFLDTLKTVDDGVAAYYFKHGAGSDQSPDNLSAASDQAAAIGRSQRAFRATLRAAQARLLYVFNQTRGNDPGYKK